MGEQLISLPGEIWKPVVGFPGYEVSNLGRVLSLARNVEKMGRGGRPYVAHYHTRLLKFYVFHIWKCGSKVGEQAMCLGLLRDGKQERVFVHRAVLEAFVSPCPPDLEGCHTDGNIRNNHLDNLRWDTRLSNAQDMVRHGRSGKQRYRIGSRHHRAKITESIAIEIKRLGGGMKPTHLARHLGVSVDIVRHVIKENTWRHVDG